MKTYYSKAIRMQNEAYNPCLKNDGKTLAYIKVEGKKEYLALNMDGKEIALTDKTYILSPIFANDFLLFVIKENKNWLIKAIDTNTLETFIPFKTIGRPRGISVFEGCQKTVIAWEERLGIETKIRCTYLENNKFSTPFDVTNGSYNAYDPSACLDKNDELFVAFSAFYKGNYRICIAQPNSKKEQFIKLRFEPAVYPFISPASQGGVYLSYTIFSPSDKNTFVYHLKRMAQHKFSGNLAQLKAAYFDGQDYYAFIDKNLEGGSRCEMLVYGCNGAGHSKIFEDENGNVNILFKKHHNMDISDADTLYYEAHQSYDTRPLQSFSQKQSQPGIFLTTYQKDTWSEPKSLLQRSLYEVPISYVLKGEKLTLAIAEDGRHTGWAVMGEWFDKQGKTAVGILEFELSKETYNINLIKHQHTATFGYSLEEEMAREVEVGDYLCVQGQLHFHSDLSVCGRAFDRDADSNYRFMQDVQKLKFGSANDHCYNVWLSEQVIMNKNADYYYFPGEFVALSGYEWTATNSCTHQGGPFGHMNPICFEENGFLEVFPGNDPDCEGSNPRRLWDFYGERPIITPPHHPICNAHKYNWGFFDEKFVSVIEIFQDSRGSAEDFYVPGFTNVGHSLDAPSLVTKLREGLKFGFIAGGDHGGISLAGVLTKEITRTALYDAFINKRAYGTTGNDINICFYCNDMPMGSTVKTDEGYFKLEIFSGMDIETITFIKNGSILKTVECEGKEKVCTFTEKRENKCDFIYARIIFKDGDIAFISPIWMEE